MEIKGILKLPQNFWDRLATGSNECIWFWVKEDALNGIMQDGSSNHQYKSEQYKKYKANDMRRFTTGTPAMVSIKGQKDLYFKNPKVTTKYKGRTYGSGERLAGYKSGALNNDVSKVNLHLTGLMMDGLHKKSQTENSLTMSFNPNDEGKVIGNKENGYDVVGLNDANQEKVRKRLLDAYTQNISKLPKKIVINISKN